MKTVLVSLVALAGLAGAAHAQVTQAPIESTLRYEVSRNGGPFQASVNANPGDRIEWRAVVSYTGTRAAAALGRIYYQPIVINADNVNNGNGVDNLGNFRNNGVSGQGNTTLAQGLLSLAEGEQTSAIGAGYGRVRFGFTSRSTTAGNSGGLTSIRHTPGTNAPTTIAGITPGTGLGAIRIAGSNNPDWYPSEIDTPTPGQNNQILWGVVSDNPTPTSTWFTAGTTDVVIFRQAIILSNNPQQRTITLTSEAATLLRAGGGTGADDTRFMTWALNGESGSAASILSGVNYLPATIIVPAPGALALVGVGGLIAARRRRA